MTASVTLKELVNLAIGSPEPGAVNFNALYSLLHGMLDHLQLGDVRRELSQEEKEFLQPGPVMGATTTEAQKPPSLFHQLQDKIAKMESRLMHLDSLPSSTSLLVASQSQNKPVQEMWQLMQLKKKVEMNEDGVNKAMSAFQELLTTFNSLKQTTDLIQGNLGTLSGIVTKMNVEEIQHRLQKLEGQTQYMPTLADKLDMLQNKLASYPDPAHLVTWPSLHDAVNVASSEWKSSSDIKEKNTKNILSTLGKLPGRQEELEVRVNSIEEELRRLDKEISNVGIPEDLLQQLQSLRRDVEKMFAENKKDKNELSGLQNALQQLNAALQRLDSKTAKLEADLSDTATLQSQIYELDKKKLDREVLMFELNTKADKRALETKVGHTQLEAAVSEVNAVLDDLIKKLGAQEAEWQSMLGKLLASLEAKLSRSDLDSVQRDLEELWRILKKHISSGQTFDSDSAAGFRKKLFERVKCISCDRPVTMATAPQLVTVRTAPLVPRNRPNSADFSRDKSPGDSMQVMDPEFQYSEHPRPHTSCSHGKRTSRTQHLTTVYPYGDPTQIIYKNSEFDLLGVDGVMYKGRLDRNFSIHVSEKDSSASMTPQPPSRLSIERARSAKSHHRGLNSPVSRECAQSAQNQRTSLHVPTVTESIASLQSQLQSSIEVKLDP
ncbi:uncharacterized protein C16orf96 homolog [Pelodytes ibericus]